MMATIVYDSQGFLLVDYKTKGKIIKGVYYANILGRLKEAIKKRDVKNCLTPG